MVETALHLGELTLNLSAVKHQTEDVGKPYLDWLWCVVQVEVPGFSGRFQWHVMPTELAQFAADLEALHSRFPEQGTVTLRPAERNVELTFTTEHTGQIQGTYALRLDAHSGGLTGWFRIDQSYLPDVASRLRKFVKDATDAG